MRLFLLFCSELAQEEKAVIDDHFQFKSTSESNKLSFSKFADSITNNRYAKAAAVGVGVGVVAYAAAPVLVGSALGAVGFTTSGIMLCYRINMDQCRITTVVIDCCFFVQVSLLDP